MKISRYKISLSDTDYLTALENLKYDLGYQILHNHLIDELDKEGELILDDIFDEIEEKNKKRLIYLRYLKKDLLTLVDNLIKHKKKEMNEEKVIIDQAPDPSDYVDPYDT